MLKVLESNGLNVASVARAVAEVDKLEDAVLEKLVWEATDGLVVAESHNLLMAAKQAVNAIINLGTNATPDKVAAHIAKRIKLVPKPVEAAVAVGAAVEVAEGFTATEVVEAEAVADAPPSMASLVTESVSTPAKRGRGRPKLAETAYDRAVALIRAAGTADREALMGLLETKGFKRSSAYVYVWKAGKAGVLSESAAAGSAAATAD
jgi:hypothetical protein